MPELIVISVLAIVAIWTVLLDIKARKANREWLTIKTKAKVQLAEYMASPRSDNHKAHAQWCVDRYCEVCDKIAGGGLFDSKQNVLYAEYSTQILDELKRIGFFEKQSTLENKGDV